MTNDTNATYVDPYDNHPHPPSVTESFAKLTSEGMSADRSFAVLAIVAAQNSPSTLDGEHMAKIRELVRVYTDYNEKTVIKGVTL